MNIQTKYKIVGYISLMQKQSGVVSPVYLIGDERKIQKGNSLKLPSKAKLVEENKFYYKLEHPINVEFNLKYEVYSLFIFNFGKNLIEFSSLDITPLENIEKTLLDDESNQLLNNFLEKTSIENLKNELKSMLLLGNVSNINKFILNELHNKVKEISLFYGNKVDKISFFKLEDKVFKTLDKSHHKVMDVFLILLRFQYLFKDQLDALTKKIISEEYTKKYTYENYKNIFLLGVRNNNEALIKFVFEHDSIHNSFKICDSFIDYIQSKKKEKDKRINIFSIVFFKSFTEWNNPKKEAHRLYLFNNLNKVLFKIECNILYKGDPDIGFYEVFRKQELIEENDIIELV